MKILIALTVILCGSYFSLQAQIRPPGYEREVKAMEERMRTSILDTDSVTVVDTIVLFDPETFKDTTQYVKSTISWRDYMVYRLGINRPDDLLNGTPYTIMDPRRYEDLIVRWNNSMMKLDTIRQ